MADKELPQENPDRYEKGQVSPLYGAWNVDGPLQAEKVPEALYRVALLQIELEREDEAEATLERIVNSYPDAGVALLAEEKLNEIR